MLPYIVFNLRSPNEGGAMGNLLVRQAVEYGVSKIAVQKAEGGPDVAEILNSAIPIGNVGYTPGNPYPDDNGAGNIPMCKKLLTKAGYPHGLSVTYLYSNDSVNTRIEAAIAASLAPCGINLKGKPEPGSSFFVDLGNSPVNNKAGTWDMGQPGWIPDWFGNNGRTILDPLFRTRCVVNTNNYGCWNNTAFDNLIDSAESATSATTAASDWAAAAKSVMANAVIVPLCDGLAPFYSSARVHNKGSSAIIYAPNIGGPDITNVWLNPNKP